MYSIAKSDYEQLMRIFHALEHCRGSTNKEANALRKMNLLHRKFKRKQQNDDTHRGDTQGG